VHRSQLLAAGLGRSAVARLVAKGAIYPILPRVYAAGHPSLAPLALELAVMLHFGHGAVISHRSAASIWGLTPDRPPAVDVTLIGRGFRPRPGVESHRVAHLDRRDVRIYAGIPVTPPARTLIDFAATASSAALQRGFAEARVQRRLSERELIAAIDRCPGRSGAGKVRALLTDASGPAMTRSQAERLMVGLLSEAGLQRPAVNARLLGFEVDFLWNQARLVVEVDGYGFHAHRSAFERDRARDQTLVAAGYRVIRVTWRQLTDQPIATIATIAQALVQTVGG